MWVVLGRFAGNTAWVEETVEGGVGGEAGIGRRGGGAWMSGEGGAR